MLTLFLGVKPMALINFKKFNHFRQDFGNFDL